MEGRLAAAPTDFEAIRRGVVSGGIKTYLPRKLELEEPDLLGHAPETLRCNQCSGAFCGSRVGRMLNGEPFIMCGQKDAVREILASLNRR